MKKYYFVAGFIIVGAIFAIWLGGGMFEKTNDYEILCVQDWYDGELHWYFNAGTHPQWWGKTTIYKKRTTIDHTNDRPYRVRFADAAHAEMYLSLDYVLPTDAVSMSKIYREYQGSQDFLTSSLIEANVTKCVYTSGPTMTSQESFALKRNDLIFRVQDQIVNGVYVTTSREQIVEDPLTGEEKTITLVEIVTDTTGHPLRQDVGQVGVFNIDIQNFTIGEVKYDSAVENQIQQQRALLMQVQVAVAQAKEAQQRTITVKAEGEANAAKEKWIQEAEKAKQVTIAEANRDVQQLKTEQAKLYKQEQILIGEGDGERKRLVMQADGALQQKLKTYETVQEMWAQAFANFKGQMVPQMVMGGSGTTPASTGSNVASLVDLLTAKAAKDLSLDLSVKGNSP